MLLSDIIIAQIKDEGPISFYDFMEKSLYYPELGYYTASNEKIGQQGDYYTSSSLTPAFGAMIARQIMEMWTLCGEEQFTIVEYGAGTGLLCYDILGYFKSYPHLYKNLQYCIIEKSPFLRERQKKYLKEKVCWYNSIHEMKPLTGCIVSNELVDNFPVHQVVMEEELMEIFIDYKDDFYEVYSK
jgi:SAM-dependent MidA family methyltransferase